MITKNIEIMKAEVAQHIAADAVIQGQWWEQGKGCFVGCLTHSAYDNFQGVTDRFGIPLPLVHIAERIFERLPQDEAPKFFAEIPEAIDRDGRDLSRVVWVFLGDLLRNLPKQPDDIQAVIDTIIAGMDKLARGGNWPEVVYAGDVSCAADAANSAADAAADAAYAARAAAYAADAADYAADAVEAAADAAADAAETDKDAVYAEATEIQRQRVSFINAIRKITHA